MDLLPQVWDLLTILRVGGTVLGAWAFFRVGWLLAPVAFGAFTRATSGYVDWMRGQFDRMYMEVPASWCSAAIAGSVLLGATTGLLITAGLPWSPAGYHIIRVVVTLSLAVLAYRIPRIVVEGMWERRIARFEDQLLDGLTFMSNGLKSGLSLLQSMDMVREELPDPIRQEFALLLNEQRLGVPLEEALVHLEQRVGTEDVQIVVTSINILRQSGGNLAETFDTVAATIRDRKKVQGRIASLTAQGVAQGVIITAMPFVLGLILWVMDPVMISRLWTTWLGWIFLGVMLLLQLIGGWLIRRIVRVQV
jgi:tight adherence protein B